MKVNLKIKDNFNCTLKACETNHQYTLIKATKSRMYKQDFY